MINNNNSHNHAFRSPVQNRLIPFNPVVTPSITLKEHQIDVQLFLRKHNSLFNNDHSSSIGLLDDVPEDLEPIVSSVQKEHGQILAPEMGCGKSLCILYHLKAMHEMRKDLSNYLIIMPKSIVRQFFNDELPSCFPNRFNCFMLTSETSLDSWCRFVESKVKHWSRNNNKQAVVVLTTYEMVLKHYNHVPSELHQLQDDPDDDEEEDQHENKRNKKKNNKHQQKSIEQLQLKWDRQSNGVSHRSMDHSANLFSIYWNAIVCDEAQQIKNIMQLSSSSNNKKGGRYAEPRLLNVKRCKAVMLLRQISDVYRYPMTGTPIAGFWAHLGSLHLFCAPRPPGASESKDPAQLLTRRQFEIWHQQDLRLLHAWEAMIEGANQPSLEVLNLFLEHYIIIQSLKQVLPEEVQEITHHNEFIDRLSTEQSRRLIQLIREGEQIVKAYRLGQKNIAGYILAYLLRMRQLYSHPLLIPTDQQIIDHKQQQSNASSSESDMDQQDDEQIQEDHQEVNESLVQQLQDAKNLSMEDKSELATRLMDQSSRLQRVVDVAFKHLEADRSEGLLIFTSFNGMGFLVQFCLSVLAESRLNSQLEPDFLYGQVSGTARDQMIQRFNRSNSGLNHKNRVLLISMRSGGVGLNLVRATRAFLLEGDYNPTVEQQAEMRIWRIGQTKPVHIHRFTVTGSLSVDEWLRRLQHRKMESVIKLVVKYVNTDIFKPPTPSSTQSTIKEIILFISSLIEKGLDEIEANLLLNGKPDHQSNNNNNTNNHSNKVNGNKNNKDNNNSHPINCSSTGHVLGQQDAMYYARLTPAQIREQRANVLMSQINQPNNSNQNNKRKVVDNNGTNNQAIKRFNNSQPTNSVNSQSTNGLKDDQPIQHDIIMID